jgi:hypothetical protein
MRRVGRAWPKRMALHVVARRHERQVNRVNISLVKDLGGVVSTVAVRPDPSPHRSGASCAKDEDDQTWLVQSGGHRGTQGATGRLAGPQGGGKKDGQ